MLMMVTLLAEKVILCQEQCSQTRQIAQFISADSAGDGFSAGD